MKPIPPAAIPTLRVRSLRARSLQPASASLVVAATLAALALVGCGGAGDDSTDGTSATATGVATASENLPPPAEAADDPAEASPQLKAPYDPTRRPDRIVSPPTREALDLTSLLDSRTPPLVGQGSPDGGYYACHVDFNDSQAKETAMWGAWMDRIYMPWWQQCTMGRIDIRPTVYEHVHLNFLTLDVADCLTESPDGYPRRRVNGTCVPIDPKAEPRTDISTHTGSEVVLIRGYTTDTSQYQRARFDLVRLRVSGQNAVRICYQPVTQNHMKCFTTLFGPGYYDFSGLVTGVAKVHITGATANTFSVDDVRVTFGAALP